MKYLFLLTTVLIVHSSIVAQQFVVADSLTLEIMPYASISYVKNKDSKKVRVSNIGYRTKEFQYSSSIKDTIFLSPISYALKEVDIKAKRKNKFYNLGFHIEWRLFNNTFTISANSSSRTAALLILPENEDDYIEGIYIPMDKIVDSVVFKIYLLSVSNNGLPKDTILKKTLEASDFNKKAYIDVSEHYLKIPPQGIFIAFEWQSSNSNNSEQIRLLTSEKHEENYSYLYLNNEWTSLAEFVKVDEYLLNFRFGFKMRKN